MHANATPPIVRLICLKEGESSEQQEEHERPSRDAIRLDSPETESRRGSIRLEQKNILTKKHHLQETWSVNAPPSKGPMTEERPKQAPKSAM